METNKILYKKGYKYQLTEEYRVKVSVIPKQDIKTDYLDFYTDGLLVIKKGYAWDGPSGPAIDTPNFMRGSLVHDALYQLMREKYISKADWRKQADIELKDICLKDGMSKFRAWVVYNGVRIGAEYAASINSRKEEISAPV